jgi:hypothetical protein
VRNDVAEALVARVVDPGADRGVERTQDLVAHGLLGGREYEVVYDDADGYPLLAFAVGQWYDVTSFTPRPVSVRFALRRDSAWSGAQAAIIPTPLRNQSRDDDARDQRDQPGSPAHCSSSRHEGAGTSHHQAGGGLVDPYLLAGDPAR